MAKQTTRSATSKKASSLPPETFPPRTDPAADRAYDMSAPDGRAKSREPSEEEIRMRAYHRYVERGRSDGQDFEDWLYAEQELRGRR
jgi:hypothetical protein